MSDKNATAFAKQLLARHGINGDPRSGSAVEALRWAKEDFKKCKKELKKLNPPAGYKAGSRNWSNHKSKIARKVYDSMRVECLGHMLSEEEILSREADRLSQKLVSVRERNRALKEQKESLAAKIRAYGSQVDEN